MRTLHSAFAALALCVITPSLHAKDRIGVIDYYGYKGFDITKLRGAIPAHVGDPFEFTPEHLEAVGEILSRIAAGVQAVTNRPPTDVGLVCCDVHGDWEIYIGIAGESTHQIRRNPEPQGTQRLPAEALQLYEQYMGELMRVVEAKLGPDDQSRGYALSRDPKLRAIELSMHEYALAHEDLLREVLASSSDAQHRIAAAALTGYASASAQQMSALSSAARDVDKIVRNNATRALGVLASTGKVSLPTAGFIEMLSSGIWEDRNKAMMVLVQITQSGDPNLLTEIRASALDALTEMSRWQCPEHSADALTLLSRLNASGAGR